MAKETTIYDIAKELKLSPATVSRALNDHPAITSKTKNLITTKAKELGYRSNKFASNLRRQKTNTIGVIVPRLNSYLMSTVLAGMEKIANEAGYNLIISQSLESQKKEIANARTMFDGRVDALLVSVAYDTDSYEHFEAFVKKKIPLVFFDRVVAQLGCTSIVIDNVKGGYDATRHLIEQGCRRILHVTGSLKRNVYTDRLWGYQQALAESGIPFEDDWLVVTDLSPESGREVAQQLTRFRPGFDGLFVANDSCAVSCMSALKQAGISVPGDLAMVGFNDDPLAEVVEPRLTTVHYPGEEMGELAMQTLINHLNGSLNMHTTDLIVLSSELVVRQSSLKSQSAGTL